VTPDKFQQELSPAVRHKFIEDLRKLYVGRVIAAYAALIVAITIAADAIGTVLSRLGASDDFARGAATIVPGMFFVLALMFLDPDSLRTAGHPLARFFVRYEPSNDDDQMLQVLWYDSCRRRDTRRLALSILVAGGLVASSIFATAALSGAAGQALRLFQSAK
jgi:hypothetical protein